MNIIIRQETTADYKENEIVTREAFWNLFMPGCSEHFILHQLRNHNDFIPELSLVATINDKIVGNVVFTTSAIISTDKKITQVITFGPLSVLPDYQNQGIGSLLINEAVKRATALGYKAIIIFGHPEYYKKFGFKPSELYQISTEDGTFSEAMLVKELQPMALEHSSGYLQVSDGFTIDEQALANFDNQFSPKEKGIAKIKL